MAVLGGVVLGGRRSWEGGGIGSGSIESGSIGRDDYITIISPQRTTTTSL